MKDFMNGLDSRLPPLLQPRPSRLRAIIEIVDGQLKIFPVASSDVEASQILDALRFFGEGFGER
jgi:hypothetical protein